MIFKPKGIAVFLLATLSVLLLLSFAGPWLVNDDEVVDSDYCFPMSGRQGRIKEAIGFYNQNLCQFIFLAKGDSKNLPEDSLYISKNVVELGVPESSFIINDDPIYSSHEEIELFLNFVKSTRKSLSSNEDPPSVVIISDPYHTRRVSIVAGWILSENMVFRVRATTNGGVNPDLFWLRDSYVRGHTSRELFKVGFYYFRYRFPLKVVRTYLSKFDKIND